MPFFGGDVKPLVPRQWMLDSLKNFTCGWNTRGLGQNFWLFGSIVPAVRNRQTLNKLIIKKTYSFLFINYGSRCIKKYFN